MGNATAWIGTLRLRTLPAAASPVIVGVALAWWLDVFAPLPAAAALLGALLLQVGANLANDYYDHIQGADTPQRAGPTRAAASGQLPPRAVRNAAFSTFAAAAVVGLYLIWVGGWPILAIGGAGILSGLFYTKGRKSIAYVGLGEIFVFAFFGPVAVAGTVYVQSLAWEPYALLWGVPLGLLAAAILVVNNLRDIPTDAAAGKRTLAVRMGQRPTQVMYVALVAAALLAPFAIGHLAQEPLWLLPVAAGLVAIPSTRTVLARHDDRRAYNPALGATARLLLVYALLAAIGIVLSAPA